MTPAPGPFPSHRLDAGIHWHEWGREVFERALAEDRPVLLALGTTWDYHSRLMDETTYRDPRVVDLADRHVVAVRVDADERPDIDARYNAGGWPTVAILTPAGEPIEAATYLPPEELAGLLERVREAWATRRDEIAREVATAQEERLREPEPPVPGALHPGILDAVVEAVEAAYDPDRGALRLPDDGRASLHAPFVPAVRFLLYAGRRRGRPELVERAAALLRRACDGPLFDEVEGGFFRRGDGGGPPGEPDGGERHGEGMHYEKVAPVQGAMLLALGELAILDPASVEWSLPAVDRTVAYLSDVLGDGARGFRHAQEADPVYYAKDAEGRAAHGSPLVDPRVFSAATAEVARGLLQCGVAFDRREWTDRGLVAVDFLLSHMRAGEAGMYHAWRDGTSGLGMLRDQVESMLAMLHAYEVSGRASYLDHARQLARVLDQGWRDPGRGYLDVDIEHERTALLGHRLRTLDGNAAAGEAMLWLGRLTHDERYLSAANEALLAFARAYEPAGIAAAGFARTADRLLSAEPEIKVVAESPPGEPDAVADPLHAAALRLPAPGRTVQRLWREGDASLLDALGLPTDRARAAYVCVGRTCSAPFADPEQLAGTVEDIVGAGIL